MENWGQILLLIIQGILAWVIYAQRVRLKHAETNAKNAEAAVAKAKAIADRELEQIRGENAETMALVKLLGDQITSTRELSFAINEQNKILSLQGKQYADAMKLIAETNAASIQLSERIANNVLTFQEFSKGEHAKTRGLMADTTQEVTDAFTAAVEKEGQAVRKEVMALRGEWADLKVKLNNWKECKDELKPTLQSIDLRLSAIQEHVAHSQPQPDIQPDIVPPASEQPAA